MKGETKQRWEQGGQRGDLVAKNKQQIKADFNPLLRGGWDDVREPRTQGSSVTKDDDNAHSYTDTLSCRVHGVPQGLCKWYQGP